MSGKTLGQIGYEAWRKTFRSDAPWSDIGDQERRAWEAQAQAVAAHVAGTTAEDDGAAEITRLRDRLRMLLADTPFEFRPDWASEYLGDGE